MSDCSGVIKNVLVLVLVLVGIQTLHIIHKIK